MALLVPVAVRAAEPLGLADEDPDAEPVSVGCAVAEPAAEDEAEPVDEDEALLVSLSVASRRRRRGSAAGSVPARGASSGAVESAGTAKYVPACGTNAA